MVQILAAVFITLIVSAAVTWVLASSYHKKVSEARSEVQRKRQGRLLMKL